jgi:outer membrane protein OmpA-like peptidoglycan-associated protein
VIRRVVAVCVGAVLLVVAVFGMLRLLEDQDRAAAPPTTSIRAPEPSAVSARTPAAVAIRLNVIAPVRTIHVDTETPPSEHGGENEPDGGRAATKPFRAKVFFALDAPAPRSQRALMRIADALKARERLLGLRIDGHADDRGRPLHNLHLSRQRACNVARDLRRRLGDDAPPIQVRAFGESRPAAPNIHSNGSDDPRGRSKNRRVDVVVLGHAPRPLLDCSRVTHAREARRPLTAMRVACLRFAQAARWNWPGRPEHDRSRELQASHCQWLNCCVGIIQTCTTGTDSSAEPIRRSRKRDPSEEQSEPRAALVRAQPIAIGLSSSELPLTVNGRS